MSDFKLWSIAGLLIACQLHAAAAGGPNGSGNPKADFNRDIRPLFAQHCTACHGGVKAAGKLSFLYREKALAKGKSGKPAIVPGDPGASELIRRVTTDDADDRMPPSDHGPRLSAAEIGKLRQWIQDGAVWSEHWSFVPPEPPRQPKVKQGAWPKIPADYFILSKIEAEGLKPSPEAKPAEWLRRVSLDLTGLPPTPEAFAEFVKDCANNSGRAKEHVVDRLLASDAFGERWASVWLDLARYSDTFGFEKDPPRDIWPWRDWVIRAFNAGMPYDQFTIKQLAGDLLPHPKADDLLATAFHRNTQNNTEGGTDDEEYRTVAVLDRVSTTWTAWQATTFGCVQCHAHPYDPFPHRDFYRFAAFFNNTEDCDQNDDFPRHVFPKDMSQREEATRLQMESRRARERLNNDGLRVATDVRDWKPLIPSDAKPSGGTLSVGENGSVTAGGTLPQAVKYTLTVPAGDGMTAIRIHIFPESQDPKSPPERGQIFSKITAALVREGASNAPVKLREIIADHLEGPRDPRKALEGEGGGFGSYPVMKGPRECVVVLDEPLKAPAGASLQLVIEHGIASNSGVQGCQLRRFALSSSSDPRLSQLVHAPERVKAWEQWQASRDALTNFPGTSVPIMVERNSASARETRVFIRGNRLTLDEAVEPGIPDVVRPHGKEGAWNRLDMAQWLVGARNPLAARVLANRLWAEMFGHGIVETLGDFGTSGARPSHPELLDHLALRLRDDLRWSMKGFLRELALSAAYGQSSRTPPALQQRDPLNRLYARGPRTRLTAEMVRDQALAVSGLLSGKQFGPPVYPPQPDGIWSTVYSGETWKTSTGEDRYRRGVYTYHRRTSGYPSFLAFDAPTRDACTARRLPSNTPLQALATLNDPAFVEMAKALAGRMQARGGTTGDMIEHGARLLTLDKPPKDLVKTLRRLYDGALQDYRANAELSAKLGETPEKAALTLVANTLLNLDAFIIR